MSTDASAVETTTPSLASEYVVCFSETVLLFYFLLLCADLWTVDVLRNSIFHLVAVSPSLFSGRCFLIGVSAARVCVCVCVCV
jgi:hypothetical protein